MFVHRPEHQPKDVQPAISSNTAADIMAYVVDDPNVLFTIQADGAPTNTGDIYGKNTLLVQTAPNTSLKISRMLDISELSTDAQNPIRVIDYLGGDQGDEKGTSFPILVCVQLSSARTCDWFSVRSRKWL